MCVFVLVLSHNPAPLLFMCETTMPLAVCSLGRNCAVSTEEGSSQGLLAKSHQFSSSAERRDGRDEDSESETVVSEEDKKYPRRCVYVYLCVHMYVCVSVYLSAYTYIHVCVCVCVRTYLHPYVCGGKLGHTKLVGIMCVCKQGLLIMWCWCS